MHDMWDDENADDDWSIDGGDFGDSLHSAIEEMRGRRCNKRKVVVQVCLDTGGIANSLQRPASAPLRRRDKHREQEISHQRTSRHGSAIFGVRSPIDLLHRSEIQFELVCDQEITWKRLALGVAQRYGTTTARSAMILGMKAGGSSNSPGTSTRACQGRSGGVLAGRTNGVNTFEPTSSFVPVNVSAVGPGKQDDFRHPDFKVFGGGEYSLDAPPVLASAALPASAFGGCADGHNADLDNREVGNAASVGENGSRNRKRRSIVFQNTEVLADCAGDGGGGKGGSYHRGEDDTQKELERATKGHAGNNLFSRSPVETGGHGKNKKTGGVGNSEGPESGNKSSVVTVGFEPGGWREKARHALFRADHPDALPEAGGGEGRVKEEDEKQGNEADGGRQATVRAKSATMKKRKPQVWVTLTHGVQLEKRLHQQKPRHGHGEEEKEHAADSARSRPSGATSGGGGRGGLPLLPRWYSVAFAVSKHGAAVRGRALELELAFQAEQLARQHRNERLINEKRDRAKIIEMQKILERQLNPDMRVESIEELAEAVGAATWMIALPQEKALVAQLLSEFTPHLLTLFSIYCGKSPARADIASRGTMSLASFTNFANRCGFQNSPLSRFVKAVFLRSNIFAPGFAARDLLGRFYFFSVPVRSSAVVPSSSSSSSSSPSSSSSSSSGHDAPHNRLVPAREATSALVGVREGDEGSGKDDEDKEDSQLGDRPSPNASGYGNNLARGRVGLSSGSSAAAATTEAAARAERLGGTGARMKKVADYFEIREQRKKDEEQRRLDAFYRALDPNAEGAGVPMSSGDVVAAALAVAAAPSAAGGSRGGGGDEDASESNSSVASSDGSNSRSTSSGGGGGGRSSSRGGVGKSRREKEKGFGRGQRGGEGDGGGSGGEEEKKDGSGRRQKRSSRPAISDLDRDPDLLTDFGGARARAADARRAQQLLLDRFARRDRHRHDPVKLSPQVVSLLAALPTAALSPLHHHHHPSLQDAKAALGSTSPSTSPVEPLLPLGRSSSSSSAAVASRSGERDSEEVRVVEMRTFDERPNRSESDLLSFPEFLWCVWNLAMLKTSPLSPDGKAAAAAATATASAASLSALSLGPSAQPHHHHHHHHGGSRHHHYHHTDGSEEGHNGGGGGGDDDGTAATEVSASTKHTMFSLKSPSLALLNDHPHHPSHKDHHDDEEAADQEAARVYGVFGGEHSDNDDDEDGDGVAGGGGGGRGGGSAVPSTRSGPRHRVSASASRSSTGTQGGGANGRGTRPGRGGRSGDGGGGRAAAVGSSSSSSFSSGAAGGWSSAQTPREKQRRKEEQRLVREVGVLTVLGRDASTRKHKGLGQRVQYFLEKSVMGLVPRKSMEDMIFKAFHTDAVLLELGRISNQLRRVFHQYSTLDSQAAEENEEEVEEEDAEGGATKKKKKKKKKIAPGTSLATEAAVAQGAAAAAAAEAQSLLKHVAHRQKYQHHHHHHHGASSSPNSNKRVEQALRKAADLKRKADELTSKLATEDDTMSLGEFVAIMAHTRLLTSQQTRYIFHTSQTASPPADSEAQQQQTLGAPGRGGGGGGGAADSHSAKSPGTRGGSAAASHGRGDSGRKQKAAAGGSSAKGGEQDDDVAQAAALMQAAFMSESTLDGGRGGDGGVGGAGGSGGDVMAVPDNLFDMHGESNDEKNSDELNQLDYPEFLEALLRVAFIKYHESDRGTSLLQRLRHVCSAVAALDGKPRSAAVVAASMKKDQVARFAALHEQQQKQLQQKGIPQQKKTDTALSPTRQLKMQRKRSMYFS